MQPHVAHVVLSVVYNRAKRLLSGKYFFLQDFFYEVFMKQRHLFTQK